MALNDLMNRGKEKIVDMNEVRKKRASEEHIPIITNRGKMEISIQTDNYLYLNKDDSVLYEMVRCEWSGPKYKTITKSETKGAKEGKTKRKGRLTGALVGSIIVPGAGTLVGAMVGTGNKKQKGSMHSSTITYDEQVEEEAPGYVKLRNIDTNEHFVIQFICKNETYNKISALSSLQPTFEQTQFIEQQQEYDPYEELKKAKELLDLGIISFEEFETKKKQILGL